jgi:transglutaminase-like putative cysteine protease
MLLTHPEAGNATKKRTGGEVNSDSLAETTYCNYSHPAIQTLSTKLQGEVEGRSDLIEKIFLFVRDQIVFGGDHWQVKASETLAKGYGACFNKNLLMIALLRAAKIPSKLMANPLRKSFTKPSVGSAYLFFSDPFYHCFTQALMEDRWVAIDPTLDPTTYATFFQPTGVTWSIDWDRSSDMLLYSESVDGPSCEFIHMDDALSKNLDSHFLFTHEPKWIRSLWLAIGNRKMWRRTGRFPDECPC